MANYTVAREADGIVVCRLTGFLSEGESLAFATAVLSEVTTDADAGRASRLL